MSDPSQKLSRIGPPPDAFHFGRNWQRYIATYLDPQRIAIAKKSLTTFIGEDIEGSVFLDIGSGSGLFSLAAFELGAAQVVSMDVDPDSVAATRQLRERAADPQRWVVLEGSILDPAVVAELPEADIVYSWGVLHHTGDMYTAIRHAAGRVRPGGLFCIAIYNRVTGRFLNSKRWWRIKRRYNHSSRGVQRALEAGMMAYWLASNLKARRNPLRVAREYNERGMAMYTDLLDWVGGYPFEYATSDEIVSFCRAECGMDPLKTLQLPSRDTGLNRFLFRRKMDAS
jgi:SAM-dependent methyltransferase